MTTNNRFQTNCRLTALFLGVLPFLWGGFHVFASALCTICFTIALISRSRGNGLIIYRSFDFYTVLLIVFSYGLTTIWAVDRGMALLGFVKVLPLLPFSLLLMQSDSSSQKSWVLRKKIVSE